MDTLMNSIDTIKEKITDAEYKELCDQMMELNNNKKDFYEIMYIEPYITERVEDGEREYQQRIKINKRIIQMNMSETEFTYANNKIKEFGRWQPSGTIEDDKIFEDIIEERQTQILIKRDETDENDIELNVYPTKLLGLSIIRIKKL
jgi:hypothetical protein